MVIFNGVFNFILRVPELLFWMENVSVWSLFTTTNQITPKETAQYTPGIFNLIADIGVCTYILTFSTNFLIFYKFNKNFKEAVVFFWKTTTNFNK
jgi:hypothetical protein